MGSALGQLGWPQGHRSQHGGDAFGGARTMEAADTAEPLRPRAPPPACSLVGTPVSPAPEVRGWCIAGSSREADSTGCVHTERDWLTQLWRHKSESAGQVSRPQPREEPQAEPRARPLAGFLLAWWGEGVSLCSIQAFDWLEEAHPRHGRPPASSECPASSSRR
uniref:Uncharacterized protein n=1 Tax=Rousettus aegyptiacus TaxID=9407 RepID=A0A7J8JFL4_ROUAE|nr:hypothetical protein HJG63_010075 [Rousettus aegyptiacus]